MLKLKVKDVEIESDERCFVYCEDEAGDIYEFPVAYSKCRIIALLLMGAYLPQESIYEFILELFKSIGMTISSVVISDAYNNRAVVNLINYTTGASRSFRLSIPDALIIALLSGAELYVKKEAEILLAEEIDKFFWYRFLKELDLC